jgi:hypothetical protein
MGIELSHTRTGYHKGAKNGKMQLRKKMRMQMRLRRGQALQVRSGLRLQMRLREIDLTTND